MKHEIRRQMYIMSKRDRKEKNELIQLRSSQQKRKSNIPHGEEYVDWNIQTPFAFTFGLLVNSAFALPILFATFNFP